MDITTGERDIVKQVIQRYAQFKPSHGDIRLDTVFDDAQNRYALMQVGWDREDEGRVVLHYSNNEKLVLIEILDFKQFMSDDIIAELISTS
jgi:hypothetical protein